MPSVAQAFNDGLLVVVDRREDFDCVYAELARGEFGDAGERGGAGPVAQALVTPRVARIDQRDDVTSSFSW